MTTTLPSSLVTLMMMIASAMAEGPKPAVLVGSETSADMASYLCNLTFTSTPSPPNWIEGLTFGPFLSNCTAPFLATSEAELVELVKNGTACFGVGVSLSDESSSEVDIVRPFYQSVDGAPVGIAVQKGKRETNLELVSSVQAGLVSALWAGNSSVVTQIDAGTPKSLAFPVAAVTGFLTRNGLNLSYTIGPTPIAEGKLETPAIANPVNVTIAVYKGNALPLADITGDSIDSWSGMEVEMIREICAQPGPLNCEDIIVVDTVDDRLNVLNDGRASISIGSIVVTQSRLDNTSFVQPFYYSAGPALYVSEENASLYSADATLDVMNAQPVCTVTNSAQNPAGESYGAQLIAFDTRAEAVDAVESGQCIGLLWVSHIDFSDPTLVEVAHDAAKNDPIGIAVSFDLEIGAYSYLTSLSAEWMAKGAASPILTWEKRYQGSATQNEQLGEVVNAITYFAPVPPPSSSLSSSIRALLMTALAAIVVLAW